MSRTKYKKNEKLFANPFTKYRLNIYQNEQSKKKTHHQNVPVHVLNTQVRSANQNFFFKMQLPFRFNKLEFIYFAISSRKQNENFLKIHISIKFPVLLSSIFLFIYQYISYIYIRFRNQPTTNYLCCMLKYLIKT